MQYVISAGDMTFYVDAENEGVSHTLSTSQLQQVGTEMVGEVNDAKSGKLSSDLEINLNEKLEGVRMLCLGIIEAGGKGGELDSLKSAVEEKIGILLRTQESIDFHQKFYELWDFEITAVIAVLIKRGTGGNKIIIGETMTQLLGYLRGLDPTIRTLYGSVIQKLKALSSN